MHQMPGERGNIKLHRYIVLYFTIYSFISNAWRTGPPAAERVLDEARKDMPRGSSGTGATAVAAIGTLAVATSAAGAEAGPLGAAAVTVVAAAALDSARRVSKRSMRAAMLRSWSLCTLVGQCVLPPAFGMRGCCCHPQLLGSLLLLLLF